MGVRRPGWQGSGREQREREASGDEHRHLGSVHDPAMHGDSVADKIATPSAAPTCLVAVSSPLAVPSDRAATGPWVPARWTRPG